MINPQHRVFLGGFGQGASLALHYAFSKYPVAGTIALSGHLLTSTPLHNIHKVPTLLMHGKNDSVVN